MRSLGGLVYIYMIMIMHTYNLVPQEQMSETLSVNQLMCQYLYLA